MVVTRGSSWGIWWPSQCGEEGQTQYSGQDTGQNRWPHTVSSLLITVPPPTRSHGLIWLFRVPEPFPVPPTASELGSLDSGVCPLLQAEPCLCKCLMLKGLGPQESSPPSPLANPQNSVFSPQVRVRVRVRVRVHMRGN